MAEQAYAPRWLYGPPDGMQSVLIETKDHEDQMRQAGWMDSPAAFGAETHPAKPAQAVQRSDTGAVPLSDETSAAVANLQGQLNTLAILVQRQDGEMSTLHGMMERLEARQERMEARLSVLDAASPAPPPPEPSRPAPPPPEPSRRTPEPTEPSHTTPPAEGQGRGGRK